MSSIGTYGFINAKVRAMRSFLLTESVYRMMAGSQSLKEMLTILSQTRFRKLVEKLKSEDITEIEQALIQEEIGQLRAIEKNSSGMVCRLVSLFLERYEGERLKALLRRWHHKKEGEIPVFQDKIFYDFPVESIILAGQIEEVVSLLEGTPFQKILADVAAIYKERKSLFPLELAIDRDLFDRLWRAIEPLNSKDRHIANKLLGIEIDLKNLNWIGRFKHYYNILPATLPDFLLPHGYRLRSGEIQRVVTGGSVSEVLTDVARGAGITFPEEQERGTDFDALERFLYQVLYVEARRAFGEFPFSIGAIFGYFYLMRIETKNIRTLLQAKAYELSNQEIEAHLVL